MDIFEGDGVFSSLFWRKCVRKKKKFSKNIILAESMASGKK
jgi:hypothetical protein